MIHRLDTAQPSPAQARPGQARPAQSQCGVQRKNTSSQETTVGPSHMAKGVPVRMASVSSSNLRENSVLFHFPAEIVQSILFLSSSFVIGRCRTRSPSEGSSGVGSHSRSRPRNRINIPITAINITGRFSS